jgi:hypothetical protein
MLGIGIAIMIASVVVGVIGLTLMALTSSGARSAGRRTRVAMALSDPEQADSKPNPLVEDEAYYRGDAPYQPAAEDPPYPGEAEGEDAPRWVLALAIISGAGLMLGLLMVMIASIP